MAVAAGSCLAQQWTLIAVLASGAIAAYDSAPGMLIFWAMPLCIGALFLLAGLTLNLREMEAGLGALHVHAFIQTFSLVVSPLAYYWCVFRWRWEVTLGVLTPTFATGTMVAMCMPTTVSTAFMFTQQADGDAAVAALNCAAAQLLGAVVSPLMAHALLGGAQAEQQDLPAILLSISAQVIGPFTAGCALQLLSVHGRRYAALAGVKLPALEANPRRILPLPPTWLMKMGINCLLVLILYLTFCKSFSESADAASQLGPSALGRLGAWIVAVHLALVGLAWLMSMPLSARRRVAFVMIGPQKTEVMAITILGVIFSGAKAAPLGELLMPVVFYHSIQMVFASAIVPLLRAYVKKRAAAEESRYATL